MRHFFQKEYLWGALFSYICHPVKEFRKILDEKTDELIEACDTRFEIGEMKILEEDLVQMRTSFKSRNELEQNRFASKVEQMKQEILNQVLQI